MDNSKLQLKSKKKIDTGIILLACVIFLIFCPFLKMETYKNYVGDTMVQIKAGMDSLKYKEFIPQERYSWHENLTWYQHETSWYHLLGVAYTLFGVFGVIGVAGLINYAIAALAVKENLKRVHPAFIVLTACIAHYFGFPDFLARPNLSTILLMTILLFTLMSDKNLIKKCITFIVTVFLASWFHGGMVPLFFLSFAIFVVVELIFKQYKTVLYYLAAMASGFAVTLLNPIGIKIWTYSSMTVDAESQYVISRIMEWQPQYYSMLDMILILLILIGFGVNKKLKEFDKNTILRLCFFCMYVIAACKHLRFTNYTALMIMLMCPEAIQSLFVWLNDNIFKIKPGTIKLSDFTMKIVAVACAGTAIFISVSSWIDFFPTNTMSDISALAAYDEGAIDFIKEKGYERIYNDFNTGTWLAFYDVKVHVDNRCDPYMTKYSGTDYLTNQMMINNMEDMDNFYDKYQPDALLFKFSPGQSENFIQQMIESEKYTLVYDNEISSSWYEEVTNRWLIFECNYD